RASSEFFDHTGGRRKRVLTAFLPQVMRPFWTLPEKGPDTFSPSFWHGVTGRDPHWLYFDSKLTSYAELSRLNQRAISFVTIRRRGAAITRRLDGLPKTDWHKAHLDIPKRLHKDIRYVEQTVALDG